MRTVKDLKIGDDCFRANRSVEPTRWVLTVVNETYLGLIREFPEDYQTPDEYFAVGPSIKGDIDLPLYRYE
ncbi:MAG TPA: hypothetical protein ENH65_00090 [Candidatus Aminicenantes bacterium]|nr:hypothetical protein [Candidatus Aminicenantes bacterium]